MRLIISTEYSEEPLVLEADAPRRYFRVVYCDGMRVEFDHAVAAARFVATVNHGLAIGRAEISAGQEQGITGYARPLDDEEATERWLWESFLQDRQGGEDA